MKHHSLECSPPGRSGLNVIKPFSYSLQLSMSFNMLTNVKMITIVGILTVLASDSKVLIFSILVYELLSSVELSMKNVL